MAAAARSLVRQQPLKAMERASKARAGTRASAVRDTFGNWMRYQPDTAMDWLEKLPAHDERREASYLGADPDAVPPAALQDTTTLGVRRTVSIPKAPVANPRMSCDFIIQ